MFIRVITISLSLTIATSNIVNATNTSVQSVIPKKNITKYYQKIEEEQLSSKFKAKFPFDSTPSTPSSSFNKHLLNRFIDNHIAEYKLENIGRIERHRNIEKIKEVVNIHCFKYKNRFFLRMPLLNQKIIICDYLGNKDQTNYSFVIDVCEAFEKVKQNPIGKKLLIKLHKLIRSDDPIFVFPCNFFDKLDSISDADLRNILKDMFKDKMNLDLYSNLKFIISMPSFRYKDEDILCSIIALKTANEQENILAIGPIKTFNRFSYEDTIDDQKLYLLENIPLSMDIAFFHEMNHAKHFLEKRKTYFLQGILNSNVDNIVNNASSLHIEIKGLNDQKGIMKDAEEELQLTGYTKINDEEKSIEKDEVNETAYRLYSNIDATKVRIRFPYLNNFKNDRMYIYGRDAKKIIRSALQ